MRPPTRRRLDAALLAAGALLVGGVTAVGAAAARAEQVDRLWVVAQVQRDGSALVTEIIDYDFGLTAKHGIFRVVPGLAATDGVAVTSPRAPDDVQLEAGSDGLRIRIGSPDRTVSGEQRYRIQYRLPGVVGAGGEVAWNAVGTGWEVPIVDAEIHLVAPWAFAAARCHRGAAGAEGGCAVERPGPGHLLVSADRLDPGDGITVEAGAGTGLAGLSPPPPEPRQPPADRGAGVARPAGVAVAGALLAAGATSRLVRRAGRETVWSGGAADAAHGPPPHLGDGADGHRVVRVDSEHLADLATIEFAPPPELSPAQGGVVLRESVANDHKVAWLVEAATAGAVELDSSDGEQPVLRRGPRPLGGDDGALLDAAFAGRHEIVLGGYDPEFAAAWKRLGERLEAWRGESGLWDRRADRRRIAAIVLGAVVGAAGAVGALGAGNLAADRSRAWLVGCALAAAVAGAGFAAALRSWELRVRTARGSAQFLQVESFRRFLADSEAYHAEQAAARGVLRQYTAWAVAVGEIDRWSRAVASAAVPPGEASAVQWAVTAPSLASAAASASTAPSSSGGGGGGGGGVGGGAGGGGGGSW